MSRFRSIDRLVHDDTGLSGRFDLEFEFLSLAPGGSDANGIQPDSVASLFTAVQDQLGLRRQPTKAFVDVVVIDSAERPTAN